MRTYTDAQLTSAVGGSRSWRGVLRTLGLKATSGSASRSVRRHADHLGLDYQHFTGQRQWTDHQLTQAIVASDSWADVQDALRLAPGGSTTPLRARALRIGLDIERLSRSPFGGPPTCESRPSRVNLSRAGALIAAAWFELAGTEVAWPLEPCRYDLLATRGGTTRRVQVKTTGSRRGGPWAASLSSTSARERAYAPEDVDDFFIVDADLTMFLIPMAAVAGLTAIHLGAYASFEVGPLAFPESAPTAPATSCPQPGTARPGSS